MRWRRWWRFANVEQALTFVLVTIVTICLTSMLAHSTLVGRQGLPQTVAFLQIEGRRFQEIVGPWFGLLFWGIGSFSLFASSMGIADYTSRLAADILKSTYLRSSTVSESRLYFWLVWVLVGLGSLILLVGIDQPLVLLVISASVGGTMMCLYSMLLLVLNRRGLPEAIRVRSYRVVSAHLVDGVLWCPRQPDDLAAAPAPVWLSRADHSAGPAKAGHYEPKTTKSSSRFYNAGVMSEERTSVISDFRPTRRVSRILSALAIVVIADAVVAQRPSSSINIPFETYTLPNGLTVITSIDRTTPTVAVNMWYHVGSKNEVKGRTGFAHLFEHVMFTGSGHVPYGLHDKLTEGVGGSNNGTTSNDRTTYFETVPSNYLESSLWIEADRMGFLLDSLDLKKLDAQRDIVKNERRQGVDNQPYGRAGEILAQATYPALASVLVGRHRQHGRSVGRDRGGCQELLPPVLRAEQRVSRHRRRL